MAAQERKMDRFDHTLSEIGAAAARHGWNAYLFGNSVKFYITRDSRFHRSPVVNVIISGQDFSVSKFYKSLSQNLTINKEIENTSKKYCVISDSFMLDFVLTDRFDPQIDYAKFAKFSVDAVFYDLVSHSIIDPVQGESDLKSQTIKTLDHDWTIKTIMEFAHKVGTFADPKISPSDHSRISNLSISSFKQLPDNTELLKSVLLSDLPGKSIRFLLDNFTDGQNWVFSNLINLLIDMNVSIPEDTFTNKVTSAKQMELIDVYSEFFLFEKVNVESPEEKKKRLTTTLRLLVDSPTLSIETPYIDRVTALSQSLFANAESEESEIKIFDAGVSLFAEPGECPPYGCPPCIAEDCTPRCCCCSTLDIVSAIKANCHEQIILSCNEAGDGPGPAPCNNNVVNSCFPEECLHCEDACDLAQVGTSDIFACSQLENQEWWNIPNTFTPCECFCQDGFETGGGGCSLTCVTCNNAYCQSNITVTGDDCNYNMILEPSTGCCGAPSVIAWMFCLDVSGSTVDNRNSVADNLDLLVDNLADKGAVVQFGITVFGATDPIPRIVQDFTTDANTIKNILRTFSDAGGIEYDLEAVVTAASNASWGFASSNFIMVLGDEETQVRTPGVPSGVNWLQAAIDSANDKRITVFIVDGPQASPERLQLAAATGGERFDWEDQFQNIVNNLDITVFPTSCDCLDTTPIKLRISSPECRCCKDGITNPCVDDPLDIDCINNLPDHCFDIPIGKCVAGQDCTDPDFCKLPVSINACGNVIVIEPQVANMLCCSDVGFGCDCPSQPCDTECCGPNCPGSEVCVDGQLLFPPGPAGLRQAQDEVWCNCWTVKAGISDLTPRCSHCCCPEPDSSPGDPNYPCNLLDPSNPQHQQLLNDGNCCECSSEEPNRSDCCECCLLFPDGEVDPQTGECGFTKVICRSEINDAVEAIFQSCTTVVEPPPPFDCVNLQCPENDEIIAGSDNCSATRHPDTVVLNNGIGLVAYEDHNDVSVIKIRQFKTSVSNKLLPNREFSFGRLQNSENWVGGVAKLYYYDPVPEHLLTEPAATVDPDDPTTWVDGIIFRNGPLAQQCFPIAPPVAMDDIGSYINVLIPTGTEFTNTFPSSDDIYNVKWFLFDFEDVGLIGDATDTTTSGKDYIISSSAVVDAFLQLPEHIYNEKPVPVAFPSIANAVNYSNYLENSHFVYLAYQALEDEKWNVYLRQIRLSEYEREEQISDQQSQLVSLASLNIGQVVFQIVCVNDTCTEMNDDNFLLKRSIVMEVLLSDGREVFNNGFSGNWPALCPGMESAGFPKKKVFVEFVHSVIADRCPDQFTFDSIFYNWQTGQEFTVPFSLGLSSSKLFNILSVSGDTAISLGQFDDPVDFDGTKITSSSAGVVFYDDPNNSTWSTIGSTGFDLLSEFKGIDIDQPILLTNDDTGHATRPVVRVNYKNEVFVAYQSTENGTSQIKIKGTVAPSSSLPVGYLDGRSIDSSLNSFYRPSDFIYEESLTTTSSGVNEHPDMFIDLNDVIHVCWQSNRDKRWEIYYTNSNESFVPTRITNSSGKSLKPSIWGSESGSIFITWHDNRHGNYEIFMAFNLGTRVNPLFQQDPYLASFRNFAQGWSHSTDIIPLSLVNDSSMAQCYQNFEVDFYEDRSLENLAFTVKRSDFPFSFNLPDLGSDEIVSEFQDLSQWTVVKSFIRGAEEPYNVLSQSFIATSPEIDTSLDDSGIYNVTLPDLAGNCQLDTIEFRASNASNANSSWTDPVDISELSGEVTTSSLGVTLTGRYQQVRIGFTCTAINETFSIDGGVSDGDVDSTGDWNVSGDSVRFGLIDSGTTANAVFRFPVTLAKNSEIVEAYLTVKSATHVIGNGSSIIRLIDEDNAAAFADPITVTSSIDNSRGDTYTANGVSVADAETADYLYIGSTGGSTYESYLRYKINVPKNSVVLTATIELTPKTSSSGTLNSVIYGLDDNNVDEFAIRNALTTSILSSFDDAHARGPFGSGAQIFPTNANTITLVNFNNQPDYGYLRFKVPNIDSTSTFDSATLSLRWLTSTGTPGISVARIGILGTGGENCPDFTFDSNVLQGQAFVNYIVGTQRHPEAFSPSVSAAPGSTFPQTIDIDVKTLMEAYAAVATGDADQYVGFRFRCSDIPAFNQVYTFDALDGGGIAPVLDLVFNTGTFPSPLFSFPIGWNTGLNWTAGTSITTPNVASLVQNWLDNQANGYTGGNYMGFVIVDDGSTSRRDFESYDFTSGTPSELSITYASKPPITTGNVVWNTSSWYEGETIETTDISVLVQNYLSRTGYSPGNYLGLTIEDNGSDDLFEIKSYDFDSGSSAQLTVAYIGDVGFEFSMTSVTQPRLCLPPGGQSQGTLDITPSVRVDKLGNQTTQIPLPIDYVPNQTYFIGISATNESGLTVDFPNPMQSVSCESCFRQTSTWNSVSCSLQMEILNSFEENKYFDVFVDFYYDEDRTQLVTHLDTVNNLECFTIGNMLPATQSWTNKGVEIPLGGSVDLLLWPQLSNTTGLLCGINYYVNVSTCSGSQSEQRCAQSSAVVVASETWKCNCESARWDGRFEDSPVNLRELVRWKSSGFGFSDTRLTETLYNNFNPVIRMRRNMNGIVVYETNRKEDPDQVESVYKLYASVFSVKPTYDMYASGTEFIISPFTNIYHRSDIPICEGHPCFNDEGERTKDTLEGRSPAFSIDNFDSIFLAAEKIPNQIDECQELEKNNRQSIVVHRCGVDAADLYPPDDEESPVEQPCDATELNKPLLESSDPLFQKIVRMIRVNNDDVEYHITRENSASPVVSKCSIRLTIIGTPESVAIRLKNGNNEWSKWYPFESDLGENMMEINWSLSRGSGLKVVSFQVSTYAGLSATASMTVISDYTTIPYTVNFFKPIPGDTPLPTADEAPDLGDNSAIWSLENLASNFEGVPVTSIRPTEIQNEDTIVIFTSDYIFVEIEPSSEYLSQFTEVEPPTFDFINQGASDQYDIPTVTGKRDGRTVFRGKIVIDRDGLSKSKDGLAFIVPHFANDCSDVSSVSNVETNFIRDQFNVPISGERQVITQQPPDVWQSERNELGVIKHPITIRPSSEDPYFVFGDPNYRHKKQNE